MVSVAIQGCRCYCRNIHPRICGQGIHCAVVYREFVANSVLKFEAPGQSTGLFAPVGQQLVKFDIAAHPGILTRWNRRYKSTPTTSTRARAIILRPVVECQHGAGSRGQVVRNTKCDLGFRSSLPVGHGKHLVAHPGSSWCSLGQTERERTRQRGRIVM